MDMMLVWGALAFAACALMNRAPSTQVDCRLTVPVIAPAPPAAPPPPVESPVTNP